MTLLKHKLILYIYKIISYFNLNNPSQVEQVQIANQYKIMKKLLTPSETPSINDVGFKVYSQFEEDGILLYIFSIIGTKNKRVVEICAGNGIECMATNLILNHQWEGLLFDGNKELVKYGNAFYNTNKFTFAHPPIFTQAWITPENINQLIQQKNFAGEIDLLSTDIDGNDYYIMEAIDIIKPRVIICETHNAIPSHLSLTIPYQADYTRSKSIHPDFISVSLLAMKKLLNKKGYRLIGGNYLGFNAIFMLNSIGKEYFPEVSVESVHNNSFTKKKQNIWNSIKDFPWVEV